MPISCSSHLWSVPFLSYELLVQVQWWSERLDIDTDTECYISLKDFCESNESSLEDYIYSDDNLMDDIYEDDYIMADLYSDVANSVHDSELDISIESVK